MYRDNVKLQRVTNFTCDEKIADAIIRLHEKGYYTVFSCSGHPDDKFLSPYILFDYIASIGLGELNGCNGAPIHWTIDVERGKDAPDMIYSYRISRSFSESELETFSKETLIEIAMLELTLWAFSVPHNSFDIYTTGTIKKVLDE